MADAQYFRQSSLVPYQRLYGPTIVMGYNGSAKGLAIASHQLYALPLVTPRQGKLDAIAFQINVAVTGGAHLGLYRSGDGTGGALYPGSLLVDAGSVSVSGATGIRSLALSTVTVKGGQTYWLALLSSGAPTV